MAAVSNRKYRVGTPPVLPLPLLDEDVGPDWPFTAAEVKRTEALTLEILRVHPLLLSPVPGTRQEQPPKREVDYEVQFLRRSVPGHPATGRYTVLITATWDDADSARLWESLVTFIRSECAKLFLYDRDKPAIAVEMASTHLTQRRYISSPGRHPELQRHWPDIIKQTVAYLGPWRDAVAFIGACRLGYESASRDPTRNRLTIYMAVTSDCHEAEWSGIERRLRQDCLDKLPFHLDVCIEHNAMASINYQPQDPKEPSISHVQYAQPHRQTVNLGAQICASEPCHIRGEQTLVNPPPATLGCHLEILMPGSGWKAVTLVHYQTVRPLLEGFELERHGQVLVAAAPAQGTHLHEVDDLGLNPRDAIETEEVQLESPPRVTHDAGIAFLRRRINHTLRTRRVRRRGRNKNKHENQIDDEEADQAEKARLARERDRRIERACKIIDHNEGFFHENRHLMGRLFAASGLRRKSSNSHSLSWALVKTNRVRQGINALPKSADWPCFLNPFNRPTHPPNQTLHIPHRNDPGLAELPAGTTLFMKSGSSGAASGEMNDLASYCGPAAFPGEKHHHTYEYTLVSSEQYKSGRPRQGDLGSIVYDTEGVAVGMVSAVISPAHTELDRWRHLEEEDTLQGFTVVTPIEDIVEDIKRETGAIRVRVL